MYKSLTQKKLDFQQLQKLRRMELFSPEKVSHYLRHYIITANEAELIRFMTEDGKLTELGINNLQRQPFYNLENILKNPHQMEQDLNSISSWRLWKKEPSNLGKEQHPPDGFDF